MTSNTRGRNGLSRKDLEMINKYLPENNPQKPDGYPISFSDFWDHTNIREVTINAAKDAKPHSHEIYIRNLDCIRAQAYKLYLHFYEASQNRSKYPLNNIRPKDNCTDGLRKLVFSLPKESEKAKRYPVSLDTFCKYTNCEDIIYKNFKKKGYPIDKSSAKWEKYARILYEHFYENDEKRRKYNIVIKPCVKSLKEQLLRFSEEIRIETEDGKSLKEQLSKFPEEVRTDAEDGKSLKKQLLKFPEEVRTEAEDGKSLKEQLLKFPEEVRTKAEDDNNNEPPPKRSRTCLESDEPASKFEEKYFPVTFERFLMDTNISSLAQQYSKSNSDADVSDLTKKLYVEYYTKPRLENSLFDELFVRASCAEHIKMISRYQISENSYDQNRPQDDKQKVVIQSVEIIRPALNQPNVNNRSTVETRNTEPSQPNQDCSEKENSSNTSWLYPVSFEFFCKHTCLESLVEQGLQKREIYENFYKYPERRESMSLCFKCLPKNMKTKMLQFATRKEDKGACQSQSREISDKECNGACEIEQRCVQTTQLETVLTSVDKESISISPKKTVKETAPKYTKANHSIEMDNESTKQIRNSTQKEKSQTTTVYTQTSQQPTTELDQSIDHSTQRSSSLSETVIVETNQHQIIVRRGGQSLQTNQNTEIKIEEPHRKIVEPSALIQRFKEENCQNDLWRYPVSFKYFCKHTHLEDLVEKEKREIYENFYKHPEKRESMSLRFKPLPKNMKCEVLKFASKRPDKEFLKQERTELNEDIKPPSQEIDEVERLLRAMFEEDSDTESVVTVLCDPKSMKAETLRSELSVREQPSSGESIKLHQDAPANSVLLQKECPHNILNGFSLLQSQSMLQPMNFTPSSTVDNEPPLNNDLFTNRPNTQQQTETLSSINNVSPLNTDPLNGSLLSSPLNETPCNKEQSSTSAENSIDGINIKEENTNKDLIPLRNLQFNLDESGDNFDVTDLSESPILLYDTQENDGSGHGSPNYGQILRSLVNQSSPPPERNDNSKTLESNPSAENADDDITIKEENINKDLVPLRNLNFVLHESDNNFDVTESSEKAISLDCSSDGVDYGGIFKNVGQLCESVVNQSPSPEGNDISKTLQSSEESLVCAEAQRLSSSMDESSQQKQQKEREQQTKENIALQSDGNQSSNKKLANRDKCKKSQSSIRTCSKRQRNIGNVNVVKSKNLAYDVPQILHDFRSLAIRKASVRNQDESSKKM